MHLRSLSRIVEVECNANLWEKQRLNTDQTQYKRRPDHTSRMTNESRAMIHRIRRKWRPILINYRDWFSLVTT